MNNYRPFLSFDEQIKRLKTKYVLDIQDVEFAKQALSTMSYYDLVNGYKDCFMNNNLFKPGISIEYLYTFYHFDHSIQNALFQYSVYVENFFKTALSYVLAKDFGDHQDKYLRRANFVNPRNSKRSKKLTTTLEKIHKTYNKKDEYLDEPTKHYKLTKENIPPWILFKNVNFSNTIDLYSFLKSKQKSRVIGILCPEISTCKNSAEIVKNSLTVVRKYRNNIAHNLKFITSSTGINYLDLIDTIPKMRPFTIGNFIKKDSPYSMLLAMTVLLKDHYLVDQMYHNLAETVNRFIKDENQESLFTEYCKIIGMPDNIFQIYKDVFYQIED